jgi:DNA-binding transcriptional MerR regulator
MGDESMSQYRRMYRIQSVADQLGISEALIRQYERRGIVPPAARSRAGQRVYTAADVDALRLVFYPERELVPA